MNDSFEDMFDAYLDDTSHFYAQSPEKSLTVCYVCDCFVLVETMHDDLTCQDCHDNTTDDHDNTV